MITFLLCIPDVVLSATCVVWWALCSFHLRLGRIEELLHVLVQLHGNLFHFTRALQRFLIAFGFAELPVRLDHCLALLQSVFAREVNTSACTLFDLYYLHMVRLQHVEGGLQACLVVGLVLTVKHVLDERH